MEQQLQTNLRNFGLNPSDWKVIPLNEDFAEIHSREDEGIRLLGAATRRKDQWDWESIELFEI